MTPNPNYINMIINFSILGVLIYVAIQVSQESLMKSIFIILFALSLGACSTVGGMGKDVTDAAEWSSKKISEKLK